MDIQCTCFWLVTIDVIKKNIHRKGYLLVNAESKELMLSTNLYAALPKSEHRPMSS